MPKPDIVLLSPLSPGEPELLEQDYTVHHLWREADSVPFLSGLPRGVRAIVTSGTVGADAALMAALPDLEIVAGFGVGYDAVDLDHARARGIRVTNTPDVLTDAVADMAMALVLAAARRIPLGDRWVREGRWQKGPLPLAMGLRGRRFGILGLGRIGTAIAERAAPFGLEILYTARHRQHGVAYGWRDSVQDLARDSDIMVIAAAGGEDTRHIVDAGVLAALGPQGLLVNIARGSLVDEAALVAALRDGAVAGAALDVFEAEPLTDPTLMALENVVLQPHAGSGTQEARAAIGRLMRANLAAFFAGESLPTPVL